MNKDLKTTQEIRRSQSSNEICNSYITDAQSKELTEQIGPLIDGNSYHYDTIASWSTHDILIYCLSQTIPSEVYIACWAIKEYPARIITNLKIDGVITKLHLLLDYRVPVTSPDAYQLLLENADTIQTTRIHAKLSVIRNPEKSITIVSTSNYTQNTRAEVGVITVSKAIAEHRINWITSQFK